MAWPLIAAAGMAAVGAVAGANKKKIGGYEESTQHQFVNLRDFEELNQGRSGLEESAYNQQVSSFADLSKLIGLGPGANEVSANTQFQNNFADQLQQLLGQISNPTQTNIAQNYSEAQQLFAPEQTALNQQFQDQNVASNRLSARLGRAGNDPILRNKLAQEQTRQQTMLNSQVGSYSRQLPQIKGQQVLELGGQLSNLRQGLASQALQNRQTLLAMGNELSNSERNYRLQTAGHSGNTYTTTEKWGGGDTRGFLEGGMAGFGQGMKMFGGGGGAGGAAGGGG